MAVAVHPGEALRTLKLRNHHMTLIVWPEGGRILEMQSLRTGRHLLSWWPFQLEKPERAGGIGERTAPPEAPPFASRELPDRIVLTRDLPSGLSLKKTIYLPPDSLVFHVSLSLHNPTDAAQSFTLDQSAAFCPGFGGRTPDADSGILHCRHKAFLKRAGADVEDIPYEIFERIHAERDGLEWAAFNDPISDNLALALLPEGHVTVRTEYHWWLEWARRVRLAAGETLTADFHFACTPSVDMPVLASEHFLAGVLGEAAPLSHPFSPRVRIVGLDNASAGNPFDLAVEGKPIVEGKPLPDTRDSLDFPLPDCPPDKPLRLELTIAAKYGSTTVDSRECRPLYEGLEAICAEALAAADAGKLSNTKLASILARKRIVDANRDKSADCLAPLLAAASRDARAMLHSPREAVPFFSERDCRWQVESGRTLGPADRTRIAAALSRPYDLSAPRFREPHPEAGAFSLASILLEAALYLSVHHDAELLHLFRTRLSDFTSLWERFGAVFYETIHHGVVLSSLIPAYSISSRNGWLTRAEEINAQAMILDLCAKIRRRGGIQFRLSNWWAMEAAPLAYAAALFPYLPQRDDYTSVAVESFHWLLVHGALADGGFWEMSPSYHLVTLEYLMHIAEAMLRSGDNLYVSGIAGRSLAEMADFVKRIAMPPGRLPAFDDSSRAIRPEVLLWLSKRLGDAELAFHAEAASSRSDSPRPALALFVPLAPPKASRPDRPSEVLKASGKLIMRSPDRNLTLILDFGPHGGWHGHNDKLSFELFCRDVCLVPDAGSYKYEDALQWTWFKTAAAHNTVTLGDANQLPVCGHLVEFAETPSVVTAAVSADTYPDISHLREISVSDRSILVDDFIENAPPGTPLIWRLNSFTPVSVSGATATLARHGVQLKVTALTEGASLTVAQVPLMPEDAASGSACVSGWQVRIQTAASEPCERISVRLDLDWSD